AVSEVAGYVFGVVLFCSSDATGQAGSRCSQASSIPGSEGFVSGPQQLMDSSCQPWLLVSPSDDGLCVGHIICAFAGVRADSVCKLLIVYVVVVSSCLLEHVPVCCRKTVLKSAHRSQERR